MRRCCTKLLPLFAGRALKQLVHVPSLFILSFFNNLFILFMLTFRICSWGFCNLPHLIHLLFVDLFLYLKIYFVLFLTTFPLLLVYNWLVFFCLPRIIYFLLLHVTIFLAFYVLFCYLHFSFNLPL
jgi:hypothetical protein